jgi:hypothetical protein
MSMLQAFATDIQQLSKVNRQWLVMPTNQEWVQSSTLPENSTFNDQIVQHLSLVVRHLKSVSTNHLSSTQRQHREDLLNELNTYAMQGVFPTNDFLSYQNPVFIDRKGVHCAVGYLMLKSGHENLAQEINMNQRFAYVNEITHPQLKSWASMHGFTQDELAWIQPGYPSTIGMSKVSEGVDGEVFCMATINPTTYIIGGLFSKELKNNQTCNNIALVTYNGTTYEITPILNGINGKVQALFVDGSNIYIGGDFTEANGLSAKNIVMYDMLSSIQPFVSLGQLNNPVTAIIKFNNELLAASNSAGDLLSKWNGTSWNDANTGLYGNEIRCMQVFENQLYLGGDFELPTGALRKHVAIYNPNGLVMMSHFGTLTPVNCFQIFKNELYAGCDFIKGTDSCAIALLTPTEWKVLFKNLYSSGLNEQIKSMCTDNEKLHLFGQFACNTMMYTSNHHAVLRYQSNQAYISEGVNLNSNVNASFLSNDKILFGGAFTQNNLQIPGNISYANRIAYINAEPLSTSKDLVEVKFNIFPNPSEDVIELQLTNYSLPQTAQVYNAQGQFISNYTIYNNQINIKDLSTGVYILSINYDKSKKITTQFIKK